MKWFSYVRPTVYAVLVGSGNHACPCELLPEVAHGACRAPVSVLIVLAQLME